MIISGSFKKKISVIVIALLSAISCVKNSDFKAPQDLCEQENLSNTTLAELKLLYTDTTIQILDELIVEGYVISSDKAGNFFGSLHFQDSPVLPGEGFQVEYDLRDSHLYYAPGDRINIKLNGLYLGKSNGVYKLGGVLTAFGNQTVGRLPANLVREHITRACEDNQVLTPNTVLVDELDDRMLNTLVKIENIEFIQEELGLSFALSGEATERHLQDCIGNEILLLNSGFSDFHQQSLAEENGSIVGVLQKTGSRYQLVIRDTSDIRFNAPRCITAVSSEASDKIFISELADPDNNNKARFIELYNSGTSPLPLNGWSLRRYTNGNTEIGAITDLSEYTIEAHGTLVLSPDIDEFRIVYGFEADGKATGNSAANSNGDDNIELVDPFGEIVDTFGIVGEDGSGTNHEFEDGRALRNQDILNGSPVFLFNEWTIYNDTGAMNTVKMPQNAPEDFSPGMH